MGPRNRALVVFLLFNFFWPPGMALDLFGPNFPPSGSLLRSPFTFGGRYWGVGHLRGAIPLVLVPLLIEWGAEGPV